MVIYKPINYNKKLNKVLLAKLNIPNCKCFGEAILGLDNSNTILIVADKTPIDFRGSINSYSNAIQRETLIQDKYNARFRELQ